MKKIFYIVCFACFVSCNLQDTADCFESSGEVIKQEFTVERFNTIMVNRDIALFLKQGQKHKVEVQTGNNLLDNIDVNVVGGKLTLTNNNTCNYTRAVGVTKIFVTAPNITEIRSSTQYDISSRGVLTYPSLTVLSEDFFEEDAFTVGDFRLKINSDSFRVVFNNLSHCYVSGRTKKLDVHLASGDGRFEGANLKAKHVFINHRGTNDIIVNPQESLRGLVSSYGNVISKNKPAVVSVDLVFKGFVVFN